MPFPWGHTFWINIGKHHLDLFPVTVIMLTCWFRQQMMLTLIFEVHISVVTWSAWHDILIVSQTERVQSTIEQAIRHGLVGYTEQYTCMLSRALAISVCMPLLLSPIWRKRRFRVLNDIIIPWRLTRKHKIRLYEYPASKYNLINLFFTSSSSISHSLALSSCTVCVANVITCYACALNWKWSGNRVEGRVEVEGKQSGINKSEWKWRGSGREAEWN